MQLATEQPCQITRDRQAEAGSAELAVGPAVGLPERLEDHSVLVRCDADASVAHVEPDPSISCSDHERDSAALRELERVRQQILEDLQEPRGIGLERVGDARLDRHRELEVLLRRYRLERVREVVDHSRDRDRLWPHIELAGFDLRQIEDVVDQRQQIIARGGDRLGELDLLGIQVAVAIVGQQLREDERAVEGRPQFVRHVGKELGLVDARTLEFRPGSRKLVALLLERLGLLFESGVDLFELGLPILELGL